MHKSYLCYFCFSWNPIWNSAIQSPWKSNQPSTTCLLLWLLLSSHFLCRVLSSSCVSPFFWSFLRSLWVIKRLEKLQTSRQVETTSLHLQEIIILGSSEFWDVLQGEGWGENYSALGWCWYLLRLLTATTSHRHSRVYTESDVLWSGQREPTSNLTHPQCQPPHHTFWNFNERIQVAGGEVRLKIRITSTNSKLSQTFQSIIRWYLLTDGCVENNDDYQSLAIWNTRQIVFSFSFNDFCQNFLFVIKGNHAFLQQQYIKW